MSGEQYAILFLSVSVVLLIVATLFLAVELGEKRRQLDKTERDLAELVDEFYRRKQKDRLND